jgi:hypothetical protein
MDRLLTPVATPPAVLPPSVWYPHSSKASIGRPYAFTIDEHCGVDDFVDFNQTFWKLQPGQTAVPQYPGKVSGTMTLLNPVEAEFSYSFNGVNGSKYGGTIHFVPRPGPLVRSWCG